MERQKVHSGKQVFRFVSDRKPAYAGVDPFQLLHRPECGQQRRRVAS